MAKLVIEVPEELRGLGEAFATMVARVQGPVAGTRGGTAVDYGQVEQTIAEEAGGIELAAHRATILESLDVDVPTVIIGGLRYTKGGTLRGAVSHLGRVGVDRAIAGPPVGPAWRAPGGAGGRPGQPARGGRVGAGLAAAHGAGDGPPGATGPSRDVTVATAGEYGRLPYSRSSVERVTCPSGGRAGGGGSPGQRGHVDRHLRGALRGRDRSVCRSTA